MKQILSGEYKGPFVALRGQRGMLLTQKGSTLYNNTGPHDVVLVQWDDFNLWEETLKITGEGWVPCLFKDFYNFHLPYEGL